MCVVIDHGEMGSERMRCQRVIYSSAPVCMRLVPYGGDASLEALLSIISLSMRLDNRAEDPLEASTKSF